MWGENRVEKQCHFCDELKKQNLGLIKKTLLKGFIQNNEEMFKFSLVFSYSLLNFFLLMRRMIHADTKLVWEWSRFPMYNNFQFFLYIFAYFTNAKIDLDGKGFITILVVFNF